MVFRTHFRSLKLRRLEGTVDPYYRSGSHASTRRTSRMYSSGSFYASSGRQASYGPSNKPFTYDRSEMDRLEEAGKAIRAFSLTVDPCYF